MDCCYCGAPVSSSDYCNSCGRDVRQYKRIIYTANRLYNDGVDRAGVRDLSGAVTSLRGCLKCDKNHQDARNLLGLVYYEMGETVSAFAEWYISRRLHPGKNLADEYLELLETNPNRIETLNTNIRKFNVALRYCEEDSKDLAVLQLKKILRQNMKYVRAHQLLALLYLDREEWAKAKRELQRCMEIDSGDLMTRRYLAEIEQRERNEEKMAARKAARKKKDKHSAVTLTDGTNTIIQPINPREHIGVSAFLQIALGLVIGVFTTYFIVMPAREARVRDEIGADATALTEEIEARNVELDEANARIVMLEEDNAQLQSDIDSYAGTGGVIASYDQLISAAYAYVDSGSDMGVEQYLDLISDDFVADVASPAYVELYSFLRTGIGSSVAESYYESGLRAYQMLDYSVAINDFGKAYLYDAGNDDALYYLALSYFDSGDMANAEARFTELLNVFPQSDHADKARRRIEEIGE